MRRTAAIWFCCALAPMLCGAAASPEVAPPGKPIAHAGQWRLMGASDPAPCSARLQGAEIDTVLLINKDGALVLMGGRGDWQLDASEQSITLQIDKLPPADVKAEFAPTPPPAPITDGALLGRLRRAHQLNWTLPMGHFSADVTGLGAALDAAKACYRHTAANAS